MTTDTPRPDPGYEADTIEFHTSRCPYCGQHGSVRVTVTDLARRTAGDLIQVAFPEMPAGLGADRQRHPPRLLRRPVRRHRLRRRRPGLTPAGATELPGPDGADPLAGCASGPAASP